MTWVTLVGAVLAVALLPAAPTARAEMCSGEYQAPARRASERELRQRQEELRRAMEREQEAERLRAQQRQQQLAAEQARRAALPAGARLVEDRCTACHPGDSFAGRAYGFLGWTLVVLRMEVLNGARLERGERAAIAAHLARAGGASAWRTAAEWLLAALPPALITALIGARLRRGRLSRPRA